MELLLKNLVNRANDGSSIDDPKIEELICCIANQIAFGDNNYSDFEICTNKIEDSRIKYEIIKSMDILLFYINNYIKQ